MLDDMTQGYSLDSLYLLKHSRSRRVSSYDRSGGNHDWADLAPGQTLEFVNLQGPGIVRHIWCTAWVGTPDWKPELHYLRKLALRIYWDGEAEPSVEAPLGDFFGIGHGLCRNYVSAPLAMSPEDGRGFNCFFPMPFAAGARFVLENGCDNHANFYFYVDYEQVGSLPEDCGRFHAQFRREADTNGWAPKRPGFLEEKADAAGEPPWLRRLGCGRIRMDLRTT